MSRRQRPPPPCVQDTSHVNMMMATPTRTPPPPPLGMAVLGTTWIIANRFLSDYPADLKRKCLLKRVGPLHQVNVFYVLKVLDPIVLVDAPRADPTTRAARENKPTFQPMRIPEVSMPRFKGKRTSRCVQSPRPSVDALAYQTHSAHCKCQSHMLRGPRRDLGQLGLLRIRHITLVYG